MRIRARVIFFVLYSLLPLAILLIWIRGYWYCDRIGGPWGFTQPSIVDPMPAGQHWYYSVSSSYGQIRACLTRVDCPEAGGTSCGVDTGTVPAAAGQRWDTKKRLFRPTWFIHLFDFVLVKDLTRVGGAGSGVVLTEITDWLLVLPFWLLSTISAIPLLIVARGLRRDIRACKRQRLGLCLRCGYDLRANTERCPECGTPIEHGAGVS